MGLVSTTKDKQKGGKKKNQLPPVEQKQQPTQTEDILNSILPPREWTEDGQLWVQYVSSTPATRLDVIAFGMRKALMAEYRKTEMDNKVKQLEADREDLNRQVS